MFSFLLDRFGFLLLTSLGLLLSGTPVFANPPDENESWEETLIGSNIVISEWFDGVAEGIDLFLVGEKLTNRQNETNVQISNSTYVNDKGNSSNATSSGVNLRLPNVEQYWNLKFTDYDESKERRLREKPQLRQTPREKNYGASVGIAQKLGDDVRTSFQPRVELQDPIKVSHSLAFESLADLKTYRINPKLEFFANPDKGTGFFTAVNFNFRLTKIYSITLINEGEYEDKLHLYSFTNGISLGQSITKRSSLSYGLFFDSNNRPNHHLENYSLSVSWNHTLYKKILDYSATPHLNFPREKDYTGTPGFSFSVNLNF